MSGAAGPFSLKAVVLAMRPSQWTKNVLVLAAFFFAIGDRTRERPLGPMDLLLVIAGAALFCLASSGIYLLNDIHDVEADRQHPTKRLRPVAAGSLSIPAAAGFAFFWLAVALGGAWLLSHRFFIVLAAYVAMQTVYTYALKRLALVDVMVIAIGFVLRAIAGALVLAGVTISPWLLICTFLLALFLALCKRRHELLLSPDTGNPHRESLQDYDERLLDQLIAITAAATVVSYSVYTLWPQTILKFKSAGLGFTIPFVVFGIFRYLDVVYRHEQGGRPEKILLSDVPLIVDLVLYAVVAAAVFLFPNLVHSILP